MDQHINNAQETVRSSEYADMLSELSRLNFVSSGLTRRELRDSVVETFAFRWGMFKDEVAEIFDKEFPASMPLPLPDGTVKSQGDNGRTLPAGEEPAAEEYAFEVKYQAANGRTQTRVQNVGAGGSEGAAAAKTAVGARHEVRRILGCKSLGRVSIGAEKPKPALNLKSGGTPNITGWIQGDRLTSLDEVKVGDVLLNVCDRFDAQNLVRITRLGNEIVSSQEIAYGVFCDPVDERKTRASGDLEFAIWDFQLHETGQAYYRASRCR